MSNVIIDELVQALESMIAAAEIKPERFTMHHEKHLRTVLIPKAKKALELKKQIPSVAVRFRWDGHEYKCDKPQDQSGYYLKIEKEW